MNKILLIEKNKQYAPIAIAFVADMFRRYDIPYDFKQICDSSEIEDVLDDPDIHVACISAMVLDYRFVCEVARKIRILRPDIKIILGGRIYVFPLHLLEKADIDYMVVGDCYPTLLNLLTAIEEKSSTMRRVNGIAVFNEESTYCTPRQHSQPLVDFKPYWGDVSLNEFIRNGSPGGYPVVTGMGCVGRCTFCSSGMRGVRMRPLDETLAEMRFAAGEYDFEAFIMVTEIFYNSRKDVESFCKQYIESKFNKSWECGIRADFKVENLDLMAEAGCKNIVIGMEAYDNAALKAMGKNTTEEQIDRVRERAQVNGIEVRANIMAGNLGDTQESIARSVNYVIDYKLVSPRINALWVYPGTKVYEKAQAAGRIDDELDFCSHLTDLKYALGGGNYPNVSRMSDDELVELYARQNTKLASYLLAEKGPKEIDFASKKVRCRRCGKWYHDPAMAFSFQESICRHCTAWNLYDPIYSFIDREGTLDAVFQIPENDKIGIVSSPQYANSLLWHMGAHGYKNVSIVADTYNTRQDQRHLAIVEPVQADQFDVLLMMGIHCPEQVKEYFVSMGFNPSAIFDVTPHLYLEGMQKAAADQIHHFPLNKDIEFLGEKIGLSLRNSGYGENVSILPAGGFSRLLVKGLTNAGMRPISFYDSNYQNMNLVGDIPVLSPEVVADSKADLFLVATPSPETQELLKDNCLREMSKPAVPVVLLSEVMRSVG